MKTNKAKLLISSLALVAPVLAIVSCAYSPVYSYRNQNSTDTVSPISPDPTNPTNPTTPGNPSDTVGNPDSNDPTLETQNIQQPISIEQERQNAQSDLKNFISDDKEWNLERLSITKPLENLSFGNYSYANPSLLKLSDGTWFLASEGRKYSDDDSNNTIQIVSSFSTDQGRTWSEKVSLIVSVGGGKTHGGIAKNPSFAEVKDVQNPANNKIIMLFNISQADFDPVAWYKKPHAEFVNPTLKNWRRFYILDSKDKADKYQNGTFSSTDEKYLAKPIVFNGEQNWWKVYKLPQNKSFDEITADSELTDAKIYIDNSYNPQTRTITGNVYKDVEATAVEGKDNEFTFAKLEDLPAKLDGSIYDYKVSQTENNQKYSVNKYVFDAGIKLYTLESKDNGKTWSNLQDINSQLNTFYQPKENAQDKTSRYLGGLFAGSGNGVFLTNQKAPAAENAPMLKNNTLVFPVYWFAESNPETQTEASSRESLYIYSNDFGKTWNRSSTNPEFTQANQTNTTKSTIIEDKDGKIFISQNNNSGFLKVKASTDSGKTFTNIETTQDQNLKFPVSKTLAFAKISANSQDYFIYATPANADGTNGKLFISKTDLKNRQEMLDNLNGDYFGYYLTDHDVPFENAHIEITFQKDNYIEFVVVYQSKENLTKFNPNLKVGSDIYVSRYALYLTDISKLDI